MKRYIALLRGVNVSGKNKISMAELKKGAEGLGLKEVKTCLNSGNVIFSSREGEEAALAERMEAMIKERFGSSVPVFVISQERLCGILQSAPVWWGTGDKEVYDNLIFLIPPVTFEEVLGGMGEPKEGLERIWHCQGTVFWSFRRKDYQKTNWWPKTAGPGIGASLTIRTAGTVRKLAGM